MGKQQLKTENNFYIRIDWGHLTAFFVLLSNTEITNPGWFIFKFSSTRMEPPTLRSLLSPHNSLISCLAREFDIATIPGASFPTYKGHLHHLNTRSYWHIPWASLMRKERPAAPPRSSRTSNMAALTSPPAREKNRHFPPANHTQTYWFPANHRPRSWTRAANRRRRCKREADSSYCERLFRFLRARAVSAGRRSLAACWQGALTQRCGSRWAVSASAGGRRACAQGCAVRGKPCVARGHASPSKAASTSNVPPSLV